MPRAGPYGSVGIPEIRALCDMLESSPPQSVLITSVVACRRAELRDHSREVRLAASKGEPKGSAEARCAPRFAGGSAKRHAGHQVFQPSGRFY